MLARINLCLIRFGAVAWTMRVVIAAASSQAGGTTARGPGSKVASLLQLVAVLWNVA
jgi:hypothetical protein